ncbi:MAG: hypothetical protein QM669_13520 [Siphonobacter sp.]
MDSFAATASGLVGACTLTILHETARHNVSNAPRIDIFRKRALAKLLPNGMTHSGENLEKDSFVGTILSNATYYGMISVDKPKHGLRNGAILGLVAGLGAVLLPESLGLDKATGSRTTATTLMTIGRYLAGGVAAGLTYQLIGKRN